MPLQLGVFLDDVKRMDDTYPLYWANYTEPNEMLEAMEVSLKNGFEIDVISLDHDLGPNRLQGNMVVKRLVELFEKYGWTVQHINIHSQNPIGANNMERYLRSFAPSNIMITREKIGVLEDDYEKESVAP